MAHGGARTCVPLGILKPHISVSMADILLISGSAGQTRIASLLTASRYGRHSIVFASIGMPEVQSVQLSCLLIEKLWLCLSYVFSVQGEDGKTKTYQNLDSVSEHEFPVGASPGYEHVLAATKDAMPMPKLPRI